MFRSLLLVCLLAFAASAQSVVGDWQGTLNVGPNDLHLIVHIKQDANGALHATLDSVDQNANGIPITTVAFKDGTLTWSASALQASYEGKMRSADLIEGSFTQGSAFRLNLHRAGAAPAKQEVKPSDIDGAWSGTLDFGGTTLRLVLHIRNTADGLSASLDSPDQGAKGIPITTVTRNGATLKFESKTIAASYEGKLSADLSTIAGYFSQNGLPVPLVLKRVKDEKQLEPNRPQNPKQPFPYREEQVKYENPAAKIKLAATFSIPEGKGPFPAVLLITGSGPQDRDETVMEHKPFLVLADHLARRGIAVLRADDRGVGESEGTFATATTAEFATDAEAGVAWLKTRREVKRIGLIGHSEGAVIAPMIAARNRDVSFIVLLAGTAVRGDEIIVSQVIAGNEAAGMSHADALKVGVLERRILTAVETEKDRGKLKQQLAADIPPAQLDLTLQEMTSPWYLYFLQYDPAVALKQVMCPVLALNGDKDTQVVASLNLPVIFQALKDAGNRNFEVKEFPGLNHLFQHARTGAVAEYAQIEETMSPEVLQKISTWITALN